NVGNNPHPSADTKNKIAASINTRVRPYRSPSSPDIATPTMQPTNAEETNQPCWKAESENCFVTNGSIPDTTAMSKPNRKPPSAATAQANHKIFGSLRRCPMIVFNKRFHHLGRSFTDIDQCILRYRCG